VYLANGGKVILINGLLTTLWGLVVFLCGCSKVFLRTRAAFMTVSFVVRPASVTTSEVELNCILLATSFFLLLRMDMMSLYDSSPMDWEISVFSVVGDVGGVKVVVVVGVRDDDILEENVCLLTEFVESDNVVTISSMLLWVVEDGASDGTAVEGCVLRSVTGEDAVVCSVDVVDDVELERSTF